MSITLDNSGYEKVTVSPVRGIIIPYNGSTPPFGWVLCDGTNDTPNLVDRFLVGDTAIGLGSSGGTNNINTAFTHAGSSVAAHSDHAVTQPSAHSNHAVTQPGAHSDHSVGQAGLHGTHSVDGGHAHDAHTTGASTNAGTQTVSPFTHSNAGGHAHDAHDSHTGGALDAHSAHSAAALDAHSAHSGAALGAHSAHSVTAQSNAHGTAKRYYLIFIMSKGNL